jgi:hypothetical protein
LSTNSELAVNLRITVFIVPQDMDHSEDGIHGKMRVVLE